MQAHTYTVGLATINALGVCSPNGALLRAHCGLPRSVECCARLSLPTQVCHQCHLWRHSCWWCFYPINTMRLLLLPVLSSSFVNMIGGFMVTKGNAGLMQAPDWLPRASFLIGIAYAAFHESYGYAVYAGYPEVHQPDGLPCLWSVLYRSPDVEKQQTTTHGLFFTVDKRQVCYTSNMLY